MKWFDSSQIRGHRAVVDTAIMRADKFTGEVTIDLSTAKALIAICDQAIASEDEHDKPSFDPASVRHSKGISTAPGTVNFSKDGEIHHTVERKREQDV